MLKRIFFKNSALKFVKNFRNFCTEIDEVDEITSPGLLKKASFKESSYGQVQKFKLNFNTKTSKEKRSELLKREISSNPEFIKAFPHLKEAIKIENLEEKDEDVKSFIKSNFTIQETTESREKKTDYFQSMLNKHKGYSKVLKENNEEENDSISELVDGYHTRTGPIKFMTREEKEKIHLEIDKKMRELEESGLSRQEILLGKAEGIPLKEDKFFQFIKNEKMAREMLVKPTETFSLDLVIDRALKQDIGPDPSLALTRKDFKLNEDLPVSYAYNKYKEKFNNKNPNLLLKDDDFDYTENYEDKLKLELNKEKRKPVTFIDSPLTRPELRRKYMIKTIQSKDITWKNLPLLCRFLNEGGKIMNRYQTRLPALIHKKLARTIKHARNMGLLPNSDFLRSYHKLPFTSIYNEFYQDVSRIIDKKTGLIKIVHQPTLQDKYSYSSYSSAVESNLNRND
jgi:ribosomal protein S18